MNNTEKKSLSFPKTQRPLEILNTNLNILGIILNPDMRSKMIITLSLSIVGALIISILMRNTKE